MRDRLNGLAAIEEALWRELQRATVDRHHAWRTPVLATAGADGQADARTVVLREVDLDERRLVFYTDARSAKRSQLAERPQAVLVMWSPALGWQLRCSVRCTVHTGGLAASSRWERVRQSPSAQDYLSPLPPGTPLEGAAPDTAAPEEDAVAGEPRQRPVEHVAFAVVEAGVTAVDWLELHRAGHRRARFEGGSGRWLQP